jgi:hypothetical protein
MSCGSFRPDVTLEDSAGPIWVEVLVTHDVDLQKANNVRQVDGRMLEIDLSDTPEHLMSMPDALERWVLYDAPRRWVWLPEAVMAWEASLRQLLADVQTEQEFQSRSTRMPEVSPLDWEALRALFAERELVPIDQPPAVQDDRVGAWIWLDGMGPAEIESRLVRGAPIYRVRLEHGPIRSVYLKQCHEAKFAGPSKRG